MARRVEARHHGGGDVTLLSPDTLPGVQAALRRAGVDGWLLYDFRENNPIARHLIGLEVALSRRIFVFVPAQGLPVAVTHHIEQAQWSFWPAAWGRERYSAWPTLTEILARLVGGKRVAMEYSGEDAVPYLDRVPAGVLELVRTAGAAVVSSGELVSEFYAAWGDAGLAAHRRAAEVIAAAAHDAFLWMGTELRGGRPVHEHEVQARLLEAFARAGLETYAPPNVSADANAADPHYEPSAERPVPIRPGSVVLIDLWAKEPGGIYADQTWMAVCGPPNDRAAQIWTTIRDARDAAIAFIEREIAARRTVRGADVDDACRQVVRARGLGEFFTHRTGHSIDTRDIHGAGPNLDNLETRDVRTLIPGVGFSIEPGVYCPGEIGMRTEVNGFISAAGLLITPREIQRELMIA